MAYTVDIIPGHRADCPDGHRLQGETATIVTDIESVARIYGLNGPNITLEFSHEIKRGAAAQIRPKDRSRDIEFPLDGYRCPNFPRFRDNDDGESNWRERDWRERSWRDSECPFDWRDKNRENLFNLMDMYDRNGIRPEGYGAFAEIVHHSEGNVCIDDVERYIMKFDSNNGGDNWIEWMRNRYQNNDTNSETMKVQEDCIRFTQDTFGFLAATTSLTLGSYCPATRKITIYDVAIRMKYPSCYKEAMLATYAHELFHAVHYDAIRDFSANRDEELIILESLASFYEYSFCQNQIVRGISSANNRYLANNLYNEWDMYDVMDWPYSGAIAMADLEHKPRGNDYLFSRTYLKSLWNQLMSYHNIISAYETREGTKKKVTDPGYRTWPVTEYFRAKKEITLEKLYVDLFDSLKIAIPGVTDDAIYCLGYIRIRHSDVDTKKKRSKAIAVVKFDKRIGSINIETNMPISFLPSMTFMAKPAGSNFPYCFDINSYSDIAETVRILQESFDQMR